MSFQEAIIDQPFVLAEGAVIERLRRDPRVALDAHILHAGLIYDPHARGALEAGVRFAAAYPGNPSSEILETLAESTAGAGIYAEWSTNEKLALDRPNCLSLHLHPASSTPSKREAYWVWTIP